MAETIVDGRRIPPSPIAMINHRTQICPGVSSVAGFFEYHINIAVIFVRTDSTFGKGKEAVVHSVTGPATSSNNRGNSKAVVVKHLVFGVKQKSQIFKIALVLPKASGGHWIEYLHDGTDGKEKEEHGACWSPGKEVKEDLPTTMHRPSHVSRQSTDTRTPRNAHNNGVE